jgi:hypothetical protein
MCCCFCWCCLQEPADLAAVLKCWLQQFPDPTQDNSGYGRASVHPVKLLLEMPAAQNIASADYAAAVMLPLQQANVYYSELLLKHAAAQALQAADVFTLLDTALQQRAMRWKPNSCWGDGEVWVGGSELLLGLPAAQELDEQQIEALLGHVMASQSDRCAGW